MKILLLVLSLTQFDTIPDKQILHSSIDSFWLKSTEAELLAFKESTKYDWMNYTPSIGFGYTIGTKEVDGRTEIVGRLRPSISFNLSTVYRLFTDKQKNKRQQESIIQLRLLEAERNKIQLEELLANRVGLERKIKFRLEVLELEREQFKIKKARFDAIEDPIKKHSETESWISTTIDQKKKEESYLEMGFELKKLEAEILKVAKIRKM